MRLVLPEGRVRYLLPLSLASYGNDTTIDASEIVFKFLPARCLLNAWARLQPACIVITIGEITEFFYSFLSHMKPVEGQKRAENPEENSEFGAREISSLDRSINYVTISTEPC